MKIRFWGVRGSIAAPGPRTVRYGGNTSCVELLTDRGTLIILDCGTGMRELGDHLLALGQTPIEGHIFVTHTHWDHIQGFPFFGPVFVPGNSFTVYGPADGERHLEQTLAGQMQYAYFPVELEEIGATLQCFNLGEGDFQLSDVQVQTQYLNHPALTLAYRFSVGPSCIVYCTDHEPFSPVLFRDGARPAVDAMVHPGDRAHAEFLTGADLVIHDAQYTSEEYETKRTWGHSSIDYVVMVGLAAGVKRLALYHHDPRHDDDKLDSLQEYARSLVEEFGGSMEVFVAKEGEEIVLPERASVPALGEARVGSARLLIVDDDPVNRDLVTRTLSGEGYVLDSASDGMEALARVAEARPDLIILDMNMPNMDGLEVVRRLRATDDTRFLPVIMLTASDDEENIQKGFGAGATDYMTKPLSPPQLRARVVGWLRRSTPGSGVAS